MNHPGKILIEEIRSRDLTQKAFSLMLWKKVSELNELIKWKRNITIQWDMLLSDVLWTPEKFWIHKQVDYDYFIAKENFTQNKIEIEKLKSNKDLSKSSEQETISQKILEPIWDSISLIDQKNTENETQIENMEPKVEQTKQETDIWHDIKSNTLEELESKELTEANINSEENQNIENEKIEENYIYEELDFNHSPKIDALDLLDDINLEEDVLERDQNSPTKLKNKKDQENIFINF